MITYSLRQHIVWQWLLISIACIIFSYLTRGIDFLQQFFIITFAVLFLLCIFYIIFFPTYFGSFIKVSETATGFTLEYLDKNGDVKRREDINMNELNSFSFFDISSQVVNQRKFVFRSTSHIVRLPMVYRKKVKGTMLQTEEIIDRFFEKIEKYNNLQGSHFIERTPGFIASKAGLALIIIYPLIMMAFLLFSGKEKVLAKAIIPLLLSLAPLLIMRYKELNNIRNNKKG